MHGQQCPCIVFSSVLPSRGPLLRPDAGSEIFSRQTPHGSPQTRRTERKFRMPPRFSGSSFRNTGNERERPYRLPQPAESDGCTSSSQSKKSVVAAFRKFSPLTATDLRHAPKSHLPAAVSSARKSAMGPSTVRPLFHMRKHISERNTETGHEPERKKSTPQTAPHRIVQARRPASAKRRRPPVRVRRRPEEKPETTALRHDASARRTSGKLSATQGRGKKHTTGKTRPPSAARIPSKGDSISRHTERPSSPSARCPSQPQRAAPHGLRQRAGPVRKRGLRLRIRVFESEKCNRTRRSIEAYTFRLPLRRLGLFVFDSATIRRGEFGGHPVNG